MSLRKPNGLLFEFGPGKPASGQESATLGCGHCQKTVISKKQDVDWGVCYGCMRVICGPCYGAGKCAPWEEQLAKREQQWESRRSMGLT